MFLGPANTSGRVDVAFFFIVGICIALLLVITFTILLFLYKYDKKRHRHPGAIRENILIEITWTVIPLLLVIAMFYAGWVDFDYLRNPPKNAMSVNVTGRMWAWDFEYENGKKSDLLRVPVGKSVKLIITSKDVIHGFYIPAYRVKEDAVPGMKTHMWFVANTIGTYDIFCTEYCGTGHSHMLSKLLAMPAGDFEKWRQAKEVPESEGLKLLRSKGCLACHSTDGTKKVGPTFKGLFGSKVDVLSEGKERTVLADEAYLKKSILEPNADIVEGYPPAMPVIPLTQEELEKIVTYLKTVK